MAFPMTQPKSAEYKSGATGTLNSRPLLIMGLPCGETVDEFVHCTESVSGGVATDLELQSFAHALSTLAVPASGFAGSAHLSGRRSTDSMGERLAGRRGVPTHGAKRAEGVGAQARGQLLALRLQHDGQRQRTSF